MEPSMLSLRGGKHIQRYYIMLVNLVPVTLLIVLGSVLFPCTAIGAATIFCHQFSNLLEVVILNNFEY
jgi:hypothetical protein